MSEESITTVGHEHEQPDMDEIDWGPARESLQDGDPCPECGYPFSDEWEYRHIKTPQVPAEDWIYTCPGCEQETCVIGT